MTISTGKGVRYRYNASSVKARGRGDRLRGHRRADSRFHSPMANCSRINVWTMRPTKIALPKSVGIVG